jgi:hypothetical protein
MLRVTAVFVTAVPNTRKNWIAFEHRLSKCRGIEVALPRQTLSISVFDDKRLAHSAIVTADARLRFCNFDAPNMTAAVTDRLIFFHAIILVCLY